jgi:hypothetical protein
VSALGRNSVGATDVRSLSVRGHIWQQLLLMAVFHSSKRQQRRVTKRHG